MENFRVLKFLFQFSHSVMSNSLWTHGLQHTRPPCPLPTPGVYSNSCPLSQWCHPTIPSSVIPFSSCLQSFPASGSFQMSQFFASGGYIFDWKCVSFQRRQWHPTPVLLPGESQGQRSLVGGHLWGSIELDTTERLSSSSSCVSFRCTAKWLSYTCTYIYSFSKSFPFRLLQSIKQNSLCYIVMKKNEIMPLSAAWMDLNMIILSEERETQISYDITYMCNQKKWSILT